MNEKVNFKRKNVVAPLVPMNDREFINEKFTPEYQKVLTEKFTIERRMLVDEYKAKIHKALRELVENKATDDEIDNRPHELACEYRAVKDEIYTNTVMLIILAFNDL